jgi:preprotein translocase subunit Sec63
VLVSNSSYSTKILHNCIEVIAVTTEGVTVREILYKTLKEVLSASKAKIDYYNVLGVSPNSSYEEIKKSYQRKVLEYHPDKSKDTQVISLP